MVTGSFDVFQFPLIVASLRKVILLRVSILISKEKASNFSLISGRTSFFDHIALFAASLKKEFDHSPCVVRLRN
jgi:hypothetical protein